MGLLFLVLLIVPNLIWMRNRPNKYEEYVQNENRILQLFEKIGEIMVSCAVLFFHNCNKDNFSLWSLWLVGACFMMVLYEINWIRYFNSNKSMKDFYSSFLGIPVACASLPVMAFGLLSVYEKNPLLFVSVIILGIGHIGIHISHKKDCEE